MAPRNPNGRNDRIVAFSVAGVALAMVGMSYAAVPLYDLFCRVTGFGGTTQVAAAAPDHQGSRSFQVRFDANVAPGLAWKFEPEMPAIRVRTGETKTVFYRVTNTGTQPATGIASYNVSPHQMGSYFNKISCFCFTEQTLQPGETLEMPVVFFIDPALESEPQMAEVKGSVTLSYTFHVPKGQAQPKVGAAPVETGRSAL